MEERVEKGGREVSGGWGGVSGGGGGVPWSQPP